MKAYDSELENKKHELLTSLQDTQRGLLTTPHQRSFIEEALVCTTTLLHTLYAVYYTKFLDIKKTIRKEYPYNY